MSIAHQIVARTSKVEQQRALLGMAPASVAETISGLPAMVKAAADKLAGATTAAHVLDARDAAGLVYDASKRAARVARAKGAHDTLVAAAHRAQADALEIEAAAKRRLADEYDGAQERGEIAKAGKPVNIPNGNNLPATTAEAGISTKVIHDARAIRDVIASNPTAVREALDDILAKGDEPTRAALKRAIAPATTAIRADQQQAKKAHRVERETVLAEKIKALPTERFGVIVADPEWRFEPFSRETGMDRAADNHYPTSELEDIQRRDVQSIAADDCVLFLWATAPMLVQAIETLGAWGFAYKTHAIWVKQRPGEGRGTGYWFLGEHELLLVGTRGKMVAPAPGTQFRSVFEAPVGAHSEKPDVALEIIESYFPNLPKIELNRRGPARAGWSAWGAEANPNPQPTPQAAGKAGEAPPPVSPASDSR
jgi:N6-adenosine-specific RNA methylase IME4